MFSPRKLFFALVAAPLVAAFSGCAVDVGRPVAYHRGWDRDHGVYYVEPRASVYIPPPHEEIIHPETPRYYGRDF